MTRAANPLAHVGTHLTEADESNMHGIAPVAVEGRSGCAAVNLALRWCDLLAGEADGHQDIPVGRVNRPVELGLTAEHRWATALGERQPAVCGSYRSQPVQEELRVEGDLNLRSG